MNRAFLTICGVVALWCIGMLALVLFYIPGIQHGVIFTIAGAGMVCVLILFLSAIYKQ